MMNLHAALQSAFLPYLGTQILTDKHCTLHITTDRVSGTNCQQRQLQTSLPNLILTLVYPGSYRAWHNSLLVWGAAGWWRRE
jgi:hypothetical protein